MTAEWAIFIATIAVQCGLGAYVYGKLTERVSSHSRRILSLETDSKDHERRLGHLETGRTR